MNRPLPFSLTRVVVGLAIAVVTAVACAAVIHISGGKVWPLVELAVCIGVGAALSMAAPHLFLAMNVRRLKTLVRRPLRIHVAAAKNVLLTPRRLQFSVQAGLIYLTVFCLWLGIMVDRTHRAEVATRAIEQAGGRVVYDFPRIFGDVRTVAIARRDAPSDDATLLGLVPHIRSLRPRRIVIGSQASSTVVAEIKEAFPKAEVIIRTNNARDSQAR